MGTPDFSFGFLDATEANYAQAILDLVRGLALGLDTTVSNPPTGAIRWSATNARWEKYNGTSWAALVSKYLIDVDTLDGLHASDLALAGHNHTGTYQPLDAELTALAALASDANKLPYFTGAGAAALANLTAFARTILDDADAAAVRTTLGLVIGTHVQEFDATLAALAALTTAADKLIYATGSDTFSTCDFPAQARTFLAATTAALQCSALELGSAATLTAGTAANNLVQLNASGQIPAVSGALLTGLSALAKLALTANNVLYIDSAGAPQLLALGAAGTVLKSQGATAAPVFGTAGGDGWEYVSSATAAASAYLAFTGLNFAAYDYRLEINTLAVAGGQNILLNFGTGTTPTYLTTGYTGGGLYTDGTNVLLLTWPDNSPYIVRGAAVALRARGFVEISQDSGKQPSLTALTTTNSALCTLCGGENSTTTPVTALKIFGGAVNLASGVVKLYRKTKR